ncbi:MAG: NAD-dependent epimerase/dehydratase family protein [Acidobacteria bacterium]|nr:NAD-dependent epimerase/dehydratase family protein [Acidobacteriota bacterium]
MTDVLVLGGTGFIGIPIVEELLRANHSITVLTRGTHKPAFSKPVRFIQGNRTDPESLRKALSPRAFSVVIDNLAYTAEDVNTLVEILDGAVEQYILTSSVNVYGRNAQNPATEESVDLGATPVGVRPEPAKSSTAGKRQCELALREYISGGNRSFCFTILRPAKIHGPNDPSPRLWWYIQRVADGGPLVIAENSRDPLIRHVYVGDLARAYVGVLSNPNCRNQVYNVADEQIFSLSSFVSLIGKALQREVKWQRVPAELLQREGLAEFSHPLVATGDLIPDITRAKQDFGWYSTPTADWLKILSQWYLAQDTIENSAGYQFRERELALANRFRAGLQNKPKLSVESTHGLD